MYTSVLLAIAQDLRPHPVAVRAGSYDPRNGRSGPSPVTPIVFNRLQPQVCRCGGHSRTRAPSVRRRPRAPMEGTVRILDNTVVAHMGLPGGPEAVSHHVGAGGIWED